MILLGSGGRQIRRLQAGMLAAWIAILNGVSAEEIPVESNDPAQLARQYCATCHLFPEPSLLDKKTWREGVGVWMALRLGIAPLDYARHPDGGILKQSGIIPSEPLIPKDEWDQIGRYYEETAPAEPLPQAGARPIQVGLPSFHVKPISHRRDHPMSTLVHISNDGRRIFLGDANHQTLDLLDSGGRLLDSVYIGNLPTAVHETAEGVHLTCIGHFFPSDQPKGSLLFVPLKNDKFGAPQVLLDKLPRPTHTSFGDLTGDGQTDWVVSMFGNVFGRLSWFEGGDKPGREHVLWEKPGALRTELADVDSDKDLDIVTLIAQETEALYLFENDGQGQFIPRPIFQKHPLFGHSFFELVDFDGDGFMDVVATNGDNGEYPSPLKNYHGVRVYRNDGANAFEEIFFYPINGCFKALARDFDQDGDTDIAAISFFPDYKDNPRESFVYLENQGAMNFAPRTFAQCISGRWLTLDTGDLDEDGDLDLVLGSVINAPGDPPDFLLNIWKQNGPSILILENTTR